MWQQIKVTGVPGNVVGISPRFANVTTLGNGVTTISKRPPTSVGSPTRRPQRRRREQAQRHKLHNGGGDTSMAGPIRSKSNGVDGNAKALILSTTPMPLTSSTANSRQLRQSRSEHAADLHGHREQRTVSGCCGARQHHAEHHLAVDAEQPWPGPVSPGVLFDQCRHDHCGNLDGVPG